MLRSLVSNLRRSGRRGCCSGSCMRSGAEGEDGFQALHQLSLIRPGPTLLHRAITSDRSTRRWGIQVCVHERQAPLGMTALTNFKRSPSAGNRPAAEQGALEHTGTSRSVPCDVLPLLVCGLHNPLPQNHSSC